MGCGCGGAENKYKPLADAGASAAGRQVNRPVAASGLPKVWAPPTRIANGPKPK